MSKVTEPHLKAVKPTCFGNSSSNHLTCPTPPPLPLPRSRAAAQGTHALCRGSDSLLSICPSFHRWFQSQPDPRKGAHKLSTSSFLHHLLSVPCPWQWPGHILSTQMFLKLL